LEEAARRQLPADGHWEGTSPRQVIPCHLTSLTDSGGDAVSGIRASRRPEPQQTTWMMSAQGGG
jgi:hypothetical protein